MKPSERKAVEASMAALSSALLQLEALLERDIGDELDEVRLACPGCGNKDPESLEDTPDLGAENRVTCRKCGKSWHRAAAVIPSLEVSRG